MSWGSSNTQPPSSPASMGSPARTSQNHLPYSQYWEMCGRCCISGISDPAQALSAPLAIAFRAQEIHTLLIYSVSYIWDRKTLYGSRGGWNISILTGRQLHVVSVGDPHSIAWAICARLPVLHIQGPSRLCCAGQTPWTLDNLSQITASDATGSSPWYQQLRCLLSLAFIEKYSEKLSCKSPLWIVWFSIKKITY